MRPNVLLITTHDTGRHLGCYGVPTVHTPNLDRLADEGMRFTQYFAASSLCSPSRGVMMTGRYPQTNGMMGLCHGNFRWRLKDGEKHLSHLLHDAGYYTALIGHQHETNDIDDQLCFDEHGVHRYPDTLQHIECDKVADAACQFLHKRVGAQQPFYLQLGFFETHRPFDFGGATPDDSKGVFVPPYLQDDEAARADLAAFQGNIRKMDAAAGRVLDCLREAGLEDDTLVIYSVDHGIPYPRAKATLFDPGMAIALLMRYPNGPVGAGRTCDALLSNVDLVPTILELLGVEAPDNLDGSSFAEVFTDPDAQPRERIFAMLANHGHGNEIRCVRTPTHKLIRYFGHGRDAPLPAPMNSPGAVGRPPALLFDLREDPLEGNNLADDPAHAAVRAELEKHLWRWLESVQDPILEGPLRTPYYEWAIEDYAAWKAR